jgi:hypothetical protein
VALPPDEVEKILASAVAQTIPTTAKIFGTSEGTVRADIAAGRLPAFMLGARLWRVPSAVIRARLFPANAEPAGANHV